MWFKIPLNVLSSEDLNGVLAYFAEHPLQVCYKLATPIIRNLSNIPEITTLLGENNIWADTGDIEVTYSNDTSIYKRKKLDSIFSTLNKDDILKALNLSTTTNAIAKYSDTNGTFANSGVLIDANNHLKPEAHDSSNLGVTTQGWKELNLAAKDSELNNGIRFTNGTTTLGHIGGNLIGGLALIGGTTASTIYFEPNPSNLSIGIEVKSDKTIVPKANGDHELGSTAASWKNIYLNTSSSVRDIGIKFISNNDIKGIIGGSTNGGVGVCCTEGDGVFLRASLTDTTSGVIVRKSDVEFQAEDLKFIKDDKSASIIFNSTTNALDFVFA